MTPRPPAPDGAAIQAAFDRLPDLAPAARADGQYQDRVAGKLLDSDIAKALDPLGAGGSGATLGGTGAASHSASFRSGDLARVADEIDVGDIELEKGMGPSSGSAARRLKKFIPPVVWPTKPRPPPHRAGPPRPPRLAH